MSATRESGGTRQRWAGVPHLLASAAAWSWRLLLVVAALSALVYAILQLYALVVPVLLALFLAALLEPVVAWLRRHRWPSGLAAWAVLLAGFAVAAALTYWLAVTVRGQFEALGQELGQAVEQVQGWLVNGPLSLSAQRVDQLVRQVTSGIGATGTGAFQDVVGRARFVLELLGGVVLMVFTLFFLLKDGRRMGAWLLDRVPSPYRDDAVAVATRTRLVMREYFAGTAAVGLVDALLIGLALVIIGVPLVVPLAVLTFFGAFFPIVGATVTGLLAALVALVSGGLTDALLVVAATIVVQQVEGNLLQPLLLGKAVSLHPLVTVWAVTAGLLMGGIVGAFLAVPIVATLTRIGHYYRTRADTPARA